MRAACRFYFQHRYLADRNMTTISTPLQTSSNDANKNNHLKSKHHEPSVHSHWVTWRQQVPHSQKTLQLHNIPCKNIITPPPPSLEAHGEPSTCITRGDTQTDVYTLPEHTHMRALHNMWGNMHAVQPKEKSINMSRIEKYVIWRRIFIQVNQTEVVTCQHMSNRICL